MQVRRGGADREQVGLGAGPDQDGVRAPGGRGEPGAEGGGEAALGEVGVEHRLGGDTSSSAPSTFAATATRDAPGANGSGASAASA